MKTSEYIIVAVMLIFAGVILWQTPIDHAYKYDCQLSEISPDMPQAVKDQCRALRGKKI